MAERPRRAFLSHAGADTWVARQIAQEIEALGVETFLDEAAISVGANFEDEILAFMERADELVLLTPWALDRPYVWAEIGAAWGRRLPVVAVLHGLAPGELQTRSGAPVFLKQRNLIVLNDIDRYFAELAGRAMIADEGHDD